MQISIVMERVGRGLQGGSGVLPSVHSQGLSQYADPRADRLHFNPK